MVIAPSSGWHDAGADIGFRLTVTGPAAIVVAGGAARRFGGDDKLRHLVGGRPVLRRVLDALAGLRVDPVVVVGPRRPGIDDGCAVVREQPPGSGPLAGLVAGLDALRPPTAAVFVLAGDLPYLDPAALRQLETGLASAPDVDAAIAVDGDGRLQHLLGLWRTERLAAVLGALGTVADRPVRALTDRCRVHRVRLAVPAGAPAPWLDFDTPPGTPPA